MPPPQSTIIGNDCVSSFKSGTLSLNGGDEFVDVQGNVDISNVDEFGDVINKEFPFQIHQHTYGFDFTLDLPELIDELKSRGQFKVYGPTGDIGTKGAKGEPGEDDVLAGPTGNDGEQGGAPECVLTVEPEPVLAQTKIGLQKGLVSARVVEDSEDSYILEFDRQDIGIDGNAATKFNVRQQNSTWVLAVANTDGAAQSVFYLDIEPIIEAAHQKFLEEVDLLKKGYEDIVQFWVQTMSDLFDEQKDSLCCALEFCMSKTKSTQLRQHMENVAASALPDAKIQINNRDSGEAVELSNMGLIKDIPDGEDLCSGVELQAAEEIIAQDSSEVEQNISVDPLIHSGVTQATSLELDAGNYTAIISKMNAQINKEHYVPLIIQYVRAGKIKTTKFLDKGHFDSLLEAKNAYEGLTTAFEHEGGLVHIYYNIFPTAKASGDIELSLLKKSQNTPEKVEAQKVEEAPKPEIKPSSIDNITCRMQSNKLHWYRNSWLSGKCCGCVVNVSGQDYIIMKRSIGDDVSCGGGESISTPCIARFNDLIGHPAIAWPTLDGEDFAPIPEDGSMFRYNISLNDVISSLLTNGKYNNPKGSPNGLRHLTYQLASIIFPIS